MQLEINISGLSEEIQQVIYNAVLSAKEQLAGTRTWYSHQDAISLLGWPEILLKKGVQYGDLTPITLQGKGGTHYSSTDLTEFHNKILKNRRSKSFDPKYLTYNEILPVSSSEKRSLVTNTRSRQHSKGSEGAG